MRSRVRLAINGSIPCVTSKFEVCSNLSTFCWFLFLVRILNLLPSTLFFCLFRLGHGFGLPHWDEDFYNKNLGNCMDYTNDPSVNMQPSESNFIFLADLYGSLDGTYVRNVTHPGASGGFSGVLASGENEPEDKKSPPGGPSASASRGPPGNRRMLHRSRRQEKKMSSPLPDWILPTYREVRSRVISGFPPEEFNHRVLHRNEHGHAFEVELDDAGQYAVQFHFLLAPNNSE